MELIENVPRKLAEIRLERFDRFTLFMLWVLEKVNPFVLQFATGYLLRNPQINMHNAQSPAVIVRNPITVQSSLHISQYSGFDALAFNPNRTGVF